MFEIGEAAESDPFDIFLVKNLWKGWHFVSLFPLVLVVVVDEVVGQAIDAAVSHEPAEDTKSPLAVKTAAQHIDLEFHSFVFITMRVKNKNVPIK
jgi:hypothetical protein